jgi:hypothetical protein
MTDFMWTIILLLSTFFLVQFEASFYKPIAIWQIDIQMKANEWTQLTQDSYTTFNMSARFWGPINQNASVQALNGTKFDETRNGTIEVHGASSRCVRWIGRLVVLCSDYCVVVLLVFIIIVVILLFIVFILNGMIVINVDEVACILCFFI